MKKILLTISFFIFFPFFVSANEYLQLLPNGRSSDPNHDWKIVKYDSSTDTSVTLKTFTTTKTINFSANRTFLDAYNNKLYMFHQDSSTHTVYDMTNNTISSDRIVDTINNSVYQMGWNGVNTISKKADGSTHIGENSLVTHEVNGLQELYATNSSGDQIDINIKSGTNLLIGGRNIMDIIGGDISGSVALSSALAALPNSSPDAFYTCGLGTGIHDSSSALSAGCASDFSYFAFVDNLPKIFQTASFYIGSSFLMNGEPDISGARDMSIKAGITFKFGSVKPIRTADRNNHMLENKIDAVMQENITLKAQLNQENDSIRQEKRRY